MAQRNSLIFLRLGKNAPIFMLFFLVFYLYTVYMVTYVGKLVNNTYDYDQNQADFLSGGTTALVQVEQEKEGKTGWLYFLQSQEIALSNNEQKGVIYLILVNILLAMFMISVIRVIYTSPGSVSEEWNLRTEEELNVAVEQEREAIKSRWAIRRKSNRDKDGISLEGEDESVTASKRSGEDEPLLPSAPRVSANVRKSFVRGSVPKLIGNKGNKTEETIQGTSKEEAEIDDEMQDDPQLMEQLNQIAFYNAMKKQDKRFCAHCQKFKPERAHHCRQCNTCILKMDHHCPWVGTCVGYLNYKYFINMVFYGLLLLWLLAVTYLEPVYDVIGNTKVSNWESYFILVSYFLNCVLTGIISVFFIFHLYLILTGKTTLEVVESKKKKNYNEGILTNIKLSLGTNWWTICCPLAPELDRGGEELALNTIEIYSQN